MLSNKELDIMRSNAVIHKRIFEEIKKITKPGTKASDIDKLCWDMCKQAWVLPWFKWFYDYPANICISVNDVVVHWLPRDEITFEQWDVVTFDFGVKDKKHKINTDAAFTMIIWGQTNNPEIERFLEVNQKALYLWIEQAKVWNTLWDIWHAIEKYVTQNGFFIVRELAWHGVWKTLHEEPCVYNYWKPWKWPKIKKWMTLAIEPIIWFSSWEITDKWDWEIYIKDGSLWCQFEHTILVTDWEPEIIV